MNYLSKIYLFYIDKMTDVIVITPKIAKNLPSILEKASSMLFARNSQRNYSNWIKEDTKIKFSAIMQRKITKLYERNKDFTCKHPVFLLLCNEIIIQNPKIIIYKTSNNNLNLNCQVDALSQEQHYSANDKTIVCRHLSYGYATKQFKLNEIDSKEKLQKHSFFQKDYEGYYCYYFPAEGYYFQSKNIGKVLQDIAKNLLFTDFKGYKSYLLYTISHAMAIRIKFNNNYWKIKVYDPNSTIIETIIIVENINDITLLDVNDFNLSRYLGGVDELCLTSTDTEKIQFNCEIHMYSDNSKLQCLMKKRGHYNLVNSFKLKPENALILALANNKNNDVERILTNLTKYNIKELRAETPNSKKIPAFNLCLVKGHVASLKVYLSFILSIDILIEDKLSLVGNLVYLPIKFNQVVATVVYIKTIMASRKLSVTDKFNFIDSILLLELPYIDNRNENKALAAFVRIIQQSDFSLSQKQKLLPNELITSNYI